jgi:hypothetical protein
MTLEEKIARISELTNGELHTLEEELLAEFDKADEADDDAALLALSKHLKAARADVSRRIAETPVSAPEAKSDVVEKPAAAPAAEEKPAVVEEVAVEAETPAEVPAPAPVVEAPVEVQEGTPVAASGTVAVPRGNAPIVASAGEAKVFAGADLSGINVGQEFADARQFADAFAGRLKALNRVHGGDGEQVLVASIKLSDAPEDRTLGMNDPFKNMEKIEEVISPESITASGGCCAPLVTRYDLFDCGGVTDRPVRDSLPSFRAERGGIRFFKGPALADLQGALGFWTCADDEAADIDTPSTWKVCARINCPPEDTAELQAITMCLTFGVLQSRIFPETVVANNKLALVAQARLADSALLAQIKADSKAITDAGSPLGAVRDLLDTIGRAAIYFRDRYRIKGVPLRAIIPSWVVELLRGDIVKGEFTGGQTPANFFGISEDEVKSFFAQRNINVTWALDSSAPVTLGGGFFTEATTALPAWPTSVQWALFPEGTWLHLDGGSLDLGIVRDSGLVRVNDYMQFSETFESVVNIGCESLWITSTVDVTGKAQGPIAG